MMGPVEDGDEDEDVVLPLPVVAEHRALRNELERLGGTWTEGSAAIIAMLRPGGSGWVYLSGRETLFTNYIERAYQMGSEDARRLIKRYPTLLEGAEVVVRGRKSPRREGG